MGDLIQIAHVQGKHPPSILSPVLTFLISNLLYILSSQETNFNVLLLGRGLQRDFTVNKVFVLHMSDLSLILVPLWSPKHCQEWPLMKESGMNNQVWRPNKNEKVSSFVVVILGPQLSPVSVQWLFLVVCSGINPERTWGTLIESWSTRQALCYLLVQLKVILYD